MQKYRYFYRKSLWRDLVNKYKTRRLEKEEIFVLLENWRDGDISSRNSLVLHFLPLLDKYTFKNSHAPFWEDMQQSSVVGFLNHLNFPCAFSLHGIYNFSRTAIYTQITKTFRENYHPIHGPTLSGYPHEYLTLCGKYNEGSLKNKDFQKLLAPRHRLKELHQHLSSAYTTDTSETHNIQDTSPNPEEALSQKEFLPFVRSWIQQVFTSLSNREKDVLSKRFLEGKTHREIGEETGVSRQAVFITQNTALQKIREYVKKKPELQAIFDVMEMNAP